MRIIRTRPKNNSSILDTIPRELISELLRRVAASSYTDITNVKLSCKELNELGEEKYIYQHITLDEIPIVQWRPLDQYQETFMNKCLESGNADIMYRQALVEYFNKTNMISTIEKLQRALEADHMGAWYVTCIILLVSGDEESKQKGIQILSNIKKCPSLRKKLRSCRQNLKKQVKRMWVYNGALKERHILCQARHLHCSKRQWDVEYDVENECPTCSAAAEIDFIRDTCKFC